MIETDLRMGADFDIIEAQRHSVLDMLRLPHFPSRISAPPIWKVLVYDLRGQQTLAPIIKVGSSFVRPLLFIVGKCDSFL